MKNRSTILFLLVVVSLILACCGASQVFDVKVVDYVPYDESNPMSVFGSKKQTNRQSYIFPIDQGYPDSFTLLSIDRENAKEMWNLDCDRGINTYLLNYSLNKTSVFIINKRKLLCVDLKTGKTNWASDVTADDVLDSFDDYVYCIFYNLTSDITKKHKLVCIDAMTGKEAYSIDFDDKTSVFVGNENIVRCSKILSGKASIVDRRTGKEKDSLGDVLVLGRNYDDLDQFLYRSKNELYCYKPDKPYKICNFENYLKFFNENVFVRSGLLFLGLNHANSRLIDVKTGELLMEVPEINSSSRVIGETLVVKTQSGLLAYSLNSKSLAWEKQDQKTQINDNSVIMQEGEDKITVLNPANGNAAGTYSINKNIWLVMPLDDEGFIVSVVKGKFRLLLERKGQ